MHRSTRFLAGTIVGAGILLAGWGPDLAAALTGVALPDPVAADRAAMSVWAGMGLVRVLGAALIVVGAVAWTIGRETVERDAVYRALFFSALIGFVLATVQALAVWLTPLGALLTVPFALAALVGWRGMRVSPLQGREAA